MRYIPTWLIPLAFAALIGAGIYYYAKVRSDDGQECQRDVDCVRRVCIEDVRGTYCSRECQDDAQCLEGWRCIRPPGPRQRDPSCVRPR